MNTSSGWLVGLLVVGLGLLGGAVGTVPAEAAGSALPTSTAWPLTGEPVVVAGFDPPRTRYGAGHRGVDLAGREGEPVGAVAAGTVTFAGSVAGHGVVVVDHGSVRTTYQPVVAAVAVDTRVRPGQPIGRLGRDRHCPAVACLHLGLLRRETYLDPLLLLQRLPVEVRLLPRSAPAAARSRVLAREVAARAAARRGPDPVLTVLSGPPAGQHGFGRPVAGPLTSAFGRRLHPLLHVWKLHDGTDFAAACGAPIRAPAGGVVTAAYGNAAYGNRLLLDHGVVDGRHVVTALNHAQAYRVGVGDRVRAGQVVGAVGATGLATGCHLHLMVWLDGRLVDPMSWFG